MSDTIIPHMPENNKQFVPSSSKTYIAFNKPYAVLCQFSIEPGSDKATLANFGFPPAVYSVGRLDYDSEGLLILSDDPRLNNELLSPQKKHARTYLAQVENIPSHEQLSTLEKGVVIEGKRTLPARAEILSKDPDLPPRPVPIRERKNIPTCWLRLTLTEGRNRQVRKMTAAVGFPTLRLVRAQIGRLSLFDLNLQPGEWKKLSGQDVVSLFEPTRKASL
jgi:23S rRNA pseudouridine2457 synthase